MAKSQDAVPAPPPPFDGRWYVYLQDKVVGPYTKTQLSKLLGRGSISRDTLVTREGLEEWIAAGQDISLAYLFPSLVVPKADEDRRPGGTQVKEITSGISGIITLCVLFLIFGGSYRDAVFSWFDPAPNLASLPVNSDDFATVVLRTGCESPYSDERKKEIFDSQYRNHRMVVSGQIVTLENGSASLKVLPKSILQDIVIYFSDKTTGYHLGKGSRITVSFRMQDVGGCFLPYSGDLAQLTQ